jgi:NADH-quinone oxidoreductase subunit K
MASENILDIISIQHYLVLSSILFTIGICGIFLGRKNVINIMMAIEIMLLAVNINFVAFSIHLGDIKGQIFTFFILTVAAAEAAIGLAILVIYYRNKASVEVDDISTLKG